MWLAYVPFIFIHLVLTSCTVYESEARKFLREQGFEYSKAQRANLSLQAQKHCFTTQKNDEILFAKWEHYSNQSVNTIKYTASGFTCQFNLTQPQIWSDDDILSIEETVKVYVQQ